MEKILPRKLLYVAIVLFFICLGLSAINELLLHQQGLRPLLLAPVAILGPVGVLLAAKRLSQSRNLSAQAVQGNLHVFQSLLGSAVEVDVQAVDMANDIIQEMPLQFKPYCSILTHHGLRGEFHGMRFRICEFETYHTSPGERSRTTDFRGMRLISPCDGMQNARSIDMSAAHAAPDFVAWSKDFPCPLQLSGDKEVVWQGLTYSSVPFLESPYAEPCSLLLPSTLASVTPGWCKAAANLILKEKIRFVQPCAVTHTPGLGWSLLVSGLSFDAGETFRQDLDHSRHAQWVYESLYQHVGVLRALNELTGEVRS